MALSKAEGLRCAASFVIAAYFSVRLIPQDLRALHLDLFSLPSDSDFLRNHQCWNDGILAIKKEKALLLVQERFV